MFFSKTALILTVVLRGGVRELRILPDHLLQLFFFLLDISLSVPYFILQSSPSSFQLLLQAGNLQRHNIFTHN